MSIPVVLISRCPHLGAPLSSLLLKFTCILLQIVRPLHECKCHSPSGEDLEECQQQFRKKYYYGTFNSLLVRLMSVLDGITGFTRTGACMCNISI